MLARGGSKGTLYHLLSKIPLGLVILHPLITLEPLRLPLGLHHLLGGRLVHSLYLFRGKVSKKSLPRGVIHCIKEHLGYFVDIDGLLLLLGEKLEELGIKKGLSQLREDLKETHLALHP